MEAKRDRLLQRQLAIVEQLPYTIESRLLLPVVDREAARAPESGLGVLNICRMAADVCRIVGQQEAAYVGLRLVDVLRDRAQLV